MDRLLLSGLVLALAALGSLVAADLVGKAYASAQQDRTYIVAVSRGPALSLVHGGTSKLGDAAPRQLTCSRLVAVGEVRLGLHCQQHVKGGI